MLLEQADRIALRLVEALKPICDRVAVAGSVRRRSREVKDVELVVEPVTRVGDLFGGTEPDLEALRHTVGRWGFITKSGDRLIQIELGHGLNDGSPVKAEVYIVHPPSEWGTILAIRTGPAAFSRHCVTQLRRQERRCVGGAVYETEELMLQQEADLTTYDNPEGEAVHWRRIPTPTEKSFFGACGVPHMPPPDRAVWISRWGG